MEKKEDVFGTLGNILTPETKQRKYSRSISLTNDEFGELEAFSPIGSLSEGVLTVLRRHSELLVQYSQLQQQLAQLGKK